MGRINRPYVRIDQSLGDHRRSLNLDPKLYLSALGLHVIAIGWCDRLRTDGFVPANVLPKMVLGQYQKAAAELVRVGFWESVDGGYLIHDYLDYQDSSEEIYEKSQKAKASVARRESRKRSSNRSSNRSSERSSAEPNLTEPSLTEPSRAERTRAFDDAWENYPRHEFRFQAEAAFDELIRDEECARFVTACRNVPRDTQQSLNFFIRDGAWRDHIPRPVKPECANPDCNSGWVMQGEVAVPCPECVR